MSPKPFPPLKGVSLILLGGVAVLLWSCQSVDRSLPWSGVAANERLFREGVATILEYRCLECHNHVDAPRHGGLNLETKAAAFRSGRRAPVIVPGKPEISLLYSVLEASEHHLLFMPPKPDRLWENEKKVLYDWIAGGAHWPDGEGGKLMRPQDWPVR